MSLPKPVRGPVTSRFGPRPQAPSPHNGQDWGWLVSDVAGTTLIYAPTAGTVTVGANGLVGNFVLLPIGGGYTIRLCHMSSVAVRSSQQVARGAYLGHMGNTGSQAVGVHLHLDVFTPAGTRIDPAPFFNDTFVGSVSAAGGGATPIDPIDPFAEEQDMPRNYHNADGTMFTLGGSWARLWTTTNDFSYLTNMSAWGTPIEVNMTPDQIVTIVNECNARGAAYSAVSGGTAAASITKADVEAAVKADFDEIDAALAAIGSKLTPVTSPPATVEPFDYDKLAAALAAHFPTRGTITLDK